MKALIQYLKNQRYLSKFSIKEKILNNNSVLNTTEFIENILYYIPTANITRPNVLNSIQTVHLLINSDKSIARFGDGELQLIDGKNIPYQKYSDSLASRLKDILRNKQKNLLVGINYHYFYPKYDMDLDDFSKDFNINFLPKYRKRLLNLIDMNSEYVDASFSGLRSKSDENDEMYKNVKEVWNNKKVLLVGCENSISKITKDIFDSAIYKEYLFTPNKNAYEEYEKIYNSIQKYQKDFIIILMCGPAGKILASDLCSKGYRALDLGHIQKSYDYYYNKIPLTNDNVKEFWKPDI